MKSVGKAKKHKSEPEKQQRRKSLWPLVCMLLLLGLAFTSISWSNALQENRAATTSLTLSFDSAYASAHTSLLNMSAILDQAVEIKRYERARPDASLAFFAASFRSAIGQAQFSEAIANKGTSFTYNQIGKQAIDFVGYLMLLDEVILEQPSALSSAAWEGLGGLATEISRLSQLWSTSKEPTIERSDLSSEQIYLTEVEAQVIADQMRLAIEIAEGLITELTR